MIKTRFFEEESILELEKEVNNFLSEIDRESFIDIKHAALGASAEGSALKMYTAVVIYEFQVDKKDDLSFAEPTNLSVDSMI